MTKANKKTNTKFKKLVTKVFKPKPVTNGRRNAVIVQVKGLSAEKLPRGLLAKGFKKSGGRNNLGRVTVRGRSGGAKIGQYRKVEFKRSLQADIPGKVVAFYYCPWRTANLALVNLANGKKILILACDKLEIGSDIIASKEAPIKVGNALPLENIPYGTFIHGVEIRPGRGAQVARSAGTYAQLLSRDNGKALIRLSSGEVIKVPCECWATIGAVGNSEHRLRKLGKAGANRWRGRSPKVRGVAMNPVDHPMGGGEGKTSGGGHPRSRTGVLAKGGRTRPKKKYSNKRIVTSRHEKRKKK